MFCYQMDVLEEKWRGQFSPFENLHNRKISQVCDVIEATSMMIWGQTYLVLFWNYKITSIQLKDQQ